MDAFSRVALGQHVARQQQDGIGFFTRPADAAAELIEIRQAEAVGAVDEDRVGVRDVDAGLDDGGGQQNNLRSGTENVLGAVNLTTALKLAWENQADINQFRLLLEDQLLSSNLELTINGDPDRKLPNIISLTTPVDATRLIYALDNIGVGVSAGAACSASSQDTRVIEALGLSKKEAEQTIRISLGHNTTKDEIELAAPQIIKQINELLKTELELAKIKEIGKKLNQEYSKEDNGGN